MKQKIRLKGHESFIPREGWIAKGLEAVHQDAKVFQKNNGADELGVGTNMAKAIRYWLRVCGLIEENATKGASLTWLGLHLLEHDAYLERVESIWLLHINLIRSEELATTWYLYFQTLDFSEYTKEEIYQQFFLQLEMNYGQEKISEKSLNDDISALLRMYTFEQKIQEDPEDKGISPFSVLGLVKQNGKKYQKIKPEAQKLPASIVLYALWESLLEKKGLSIDTILKEKREAGHCLNLDRVLLMGKLEQLQEMGFLTINRTAGLDMVYPTEKLTRNDVLNNLF